VPVLVALVHDREGEVDSDEDDSEEIVDEPSKLMVFVPFQPWFSLNALSVC